MGGLTMAVGGPTLDIARMARQRQLEPLDRPNGLNETQSRTSRSSLSVAVVYPTSPA
ncbi:MULTISPECIES: hypothetical protein [Bradyrhizobium]|uniref:Uncharacterized protein n=1 Tax=Bradyrhizobium yuanmingense TaxID=108015 RepID=A0ABV4GP35_9BRAD|nr:MULTISPECIES: hypothetical protein [Bradyrhizobium]MCA1528408.1 hypothetical protein [Bradyrhizobium yuanmingense]MCA1550167.1 hypothetical protein [Bradyrhizobium sp. BRP19]